MTTNNAVNVGLSGSTGSGNFVGSNSPTLITPTLGSATATSLTFSPTTDGIVGTTTNNNASAGYVGEFISSVIPSGSAVSIPTSATPINITSISLTAGDWDVWGNVCCLYSSGGYLGVVVWSSSTSATTPDNSLLNEITDSTPIVGDIGQSIPTLRYSLTGTTTIYLSAEALFSAASLSACGGIYARRAR